MGKLLTFIYRWIQDVSWEEYVSIPIRLQVIQPRGSFRDTLILILFTYLSIVLGISGATTNSTNAPEIFLGSDSFFICLLILRTFKILFQSI